MKRILLTTALALFASTSFAQNAFYEAQFLERISIVELENILQLSDEEKAKKLMEGLEIDVSLEPVIYLSTTERLVVQSYKKFMQNPFNSDTLDLDIVLLNSAIQKYNSFMTRKMIAEEGGHGMSKFMDAGISAAIALIPGFFGGNSSLSADQQTKIIDGLTKYFAEEFRKAQLITYMQDFKKMSEKAPELTVLFPLTIKKLSTADPAKFPELGDEYKTIFNEDLKNLPETLIKYIRDYNETSGSEIDSKFLVLNRKNIDAIKASPSYAYFYLASDIGLKLTNNFHPVDLLDYLDNEYYRAELIARHDKPIEKLYLTLHGINLLQRNLRDTTASSKDQFSNVWINLSELRKLDNGIKWNYFAGLLYQQDRAFFDEFFFSGVNKTLQGISDDDIKKVRDITNNMLTALNEIKTFRANLTEKNIEDNFVGYMKLMIKTVTSSSFLARLDYNQNELDRFVRLSDYALNLYDNARKKDFSNTIYYTTQVLQEFITLDDDNKVLLSMEKYGSFMADVVNSEDSDQVKEVIKKHAAPPTSFILKREYPFTLSFTGQPGYFISAEKLTGDNQKFKFVSGISLPLGFEASFKVKRGRENAGSINLFAQLIDIGAILNFRLDDSTSTLPDQVNFKQLFSPGGALTYGFKNSPLVLGVGYQFTPELREVTQNGNQVYENGHRIFLKVAWDIPLINIAKCRKK